MKAPSTDKGPRKYPVSGPLGVRPTCAVIDLDALANNYQQVASRVKGRKILAVVKADAYGHGAVAVARHLKLLGADMLGVALLEEGDELRTGGIEGPILVMGPLFPDQAERLIRLRLTPVIYDLGFAQRLSVAARANNALVDVHVKIDTGMGRIGLSPEDAVRFIGEIRHLDGIRVQGIMTHFADADLKDKQFAALQLDRFESLFKALGSMGMAVPLRHAANSAAIIDFERALFTMVRPGLMLYGYNPLENKDSAVDLKPVLSFISQIAFLKNVPAGVPISYGRTFVTKRESVIATIAVGYADGYPRGLSNKGEALVHGTRVPIAGRVCMDMCMIDVTDIADVHVGDQVILIGSDGHETISADEIATKTGTIAYEVLCGISNRVPRIYQ